MLLPREPCSPGACFAITLEMVKQLFNYRRCLRPWSAKVMPLETPRGAALLTLPRPAGWRSTGHSQVLPAAGWYFPGLLLWTRVELGRGLG